MVSDVQGDLANQSLLKYHAPISITDNSGFNTSNGVSSGDGTAGNPYIIKNWTLNINTSDAISIEDTTAYFKIYNVHVQKQKDNNHVGIMLKNVTHGLIENCRVNDTGYGIELDSSSNITIKNTLIEDASLVWGIYVTSGSHDVKILNNSLVDDAITVIDSNRTEIGYNDLDHSAGKGIVLNASIDSVVHHNDITLSRNDDRYAIDAGEGCDGLYIHNNTISAVHSGVLVEPGSEDITIDDNAIELAQDRGMEINELDGGAIVGNEITDSYYGISIYNSEHIVVTDLTTKNFDSSAIYSSESNDLTYSDLHLDDAYYAVGGSDCQNITITDSHINNSVAAFYFTDYTNLVIRNVQVPNNQQRSLFSSWGGSDRLTITGMSANNTKTGGGLMIEKVSNVTVRDLYIKRGLDLLRIHDVTEGVFENIYLDRAEEHHLFIEGATSNLSMSNISIRNFGNTSGVLLQDLDGPLSLKNVSIRDVHEGIRIDDTNYLDLGQLTISNVNRSGINIMSSRNSTYHDVAIDKVGTLGYGVVISCCFDNEFRNVTINNTKLAGFYLNSDKNILKNIKISNSTTHALRVYWCKDNSITDLLVRDNAGNAVNIEYAANNPIRNTTISRLTAFNTFGFYAYRSNGVVLEGSYLHDLKGDAIVFAEADNITLRNNRILNNPLYIGLWINKDGKDLTMDNNTFSGNKYNLQLGMTDLADWTSAKVASNNTVDGKAVQFSVDKKDKVYNSNIGYIALVNCSNIKVENLTLSKNWEGITVRNSKDIMVRNNTISGVLTGIHAEWIYSKSNVTLSSNTVSASTDAIYINIAENITITGNQVLTSTYGVHVLKSNNVTIRQNQALNNVRGIQIDGGGSTDKKRGFNNTVSLNAVGFNTYGIVVTDYSRNVHVRNNTVYNNTDTGVLVVNYGDLLYVHNNTIYFNNDGLDIDQVSGAYKTYVYNNIVKDNTRNLHVGEAKPLAKTKTVNIVGGPYVMGNYWKNYAGVDNNGDWLGDTAYSFDTGPLLIPATDTSPPVVTDQTVGPVTTGDSFKFKARGTDDYNVDYVYVEYWTNGVAHQNRTMALTAGHAMDGTYEQTVIIPSNATDLWYFISIVDFNGKWAKTANTHLAVADNDAPTVTDNTLGPTTGENALLNATIVDNLAVVNATVEYWFDAGGHTTVELEASWDEYVKNVSAPINSKVLNYIIRARDATGNSVSKVIAKNVLDNDLPYIEGNTTRVPTTGDDFVLKAMSTDNIGLDEVYAEYWFDDLSSANVTMSGAFDRSVLITVIPEARVLHFRFSAMDPAGNANATKVFDLTVVDNDDPQILVHEPGEVVTSTLLLHGAMAEDNIEVREVGIEYWFDGGVHVRAEMYPLLLTFYYAVIEVPSTAHTYNYIITVTDLSGHSVSASGSRDAVDGDDPVYIDHTGQPTTGEPINVDIYLEDNWGITNQTIEYWFDNSNHYFDNYTNPYWIDVPSWASTFHYKVRVLDGSDWNFGTLIVRHMDVVDNDPPEVWIHKFQPATGSTTYTELIDYSDNIGVSYVNVSISFDGVKVKGEPCYYKMCILSVPKGARTMEVKALVMDKAGHTDMAFATFEVSDTIPPLVYDRSTTPYCGDLYNITIDVRENIAIQRIDIYYSIDSKAPRPAKVWPGPVKNLYYSAVDIPLDAVTLMYWISVYDTAGHIVSLNATHRVVDDVPPTIDDHTAAPQTGSWYFIDLRFHDNKGIDSTRLEWWFDDDDHYIQVRYDPKVFIVPLNARTLHYIVNITDVNGNEANLTVQRKVMDRTPPEITSVVLSGAKLRSTARLDVLARDNVNVQRVYVKYWYVGDRNYTVLDLVKAGGRWSVDLNVTRVGRLQYSIVAMDDEGNLVDTGATTVKVADIPGVSTDKDTVLYVPDDVPSLATAVARSLAVLIVVIALAVISSWWIGRKRDKVPPGK